MSSLLSVNFLKDSLNKDLRLAILNLGSPVITQEPYLVVTGGGGEEALIYIVRSLGLSLLLSLPSVSPVPHVED